MRAKFALVLPGLILSLSPLQAQTPVQQGTGPTGAVPKTAASTVPVSPAVAVDGDATAKALLQTLLQLKAANDEILKRQTATLSQLEELAKAAEQLKVYATRG
jgi:hypothetical protein